MNNLDLGPNDYRVQDPKTGRWHMPDDPKLARNMLIVLVAALAFVFVNRSAFSSGILFGVSALPSFCAGIMLALWQKNRYF